ncbi:MAG: polysaccharide pyruvyl transferase family protein [Bacteroidales bacterium]|nr:polysaccharide pyruvyl transferase family protein [Bacteroidales bacterium]
MKVGIVTMPLCANYGGTLQNWALQQVLIKLGHEPLTLRFPVDYQGMSSCRYWLKIFPYQVVRFIYHKITDGKCVKPLLIGTWRRNVQGMEEFVKRYISTTDFITDLSMDDVYKNDLEALVVGSDQIWRPIMYDAANYFFFGFAKNHDIIRVAYAPSIALDYWPFSKETTIQLRELVSKFSAVSVREESSVELVRENLHIDAQWVLDPTMLLRKEDYLSLCKELPRNKEPFVFAYILDMTEEKQQMAEKMAKEYGCKILYLTADKVKAEDTIEKWLANFRDAVYVVTDSYHGTVFSLIFKKQFYCFYNDKRGNARMDTLKKISGENNRFINRMIDELNPDIEYESIEKNINRFREDSITFLKKALNESQSSRKK